MLLFDATLILTHFWPASTLLRGHLALATLSLLVTDPQILERWSYAHEVHSKNNSEQVGAVFDRIMGSSDPGNDRRSSRQSVYLEGNGPLSGLFVPPD